MLQAGDVAEVMTPVYKGSAPKCRLTFAYHMFGTGIGKLEVTLVSFNFIVIVQ